MKVILLPYHLIEQQDLLTDFEGEPFDLQCYYGATIQLNFTVSGGDLVGTIKLQGSNDGENWWDIPNKSIAYTTPNANFVDKFIFDTPVSWLHTRIHWNTTATTATTANVTALISGMRI